MENQEIKIKTDLLRENFNPMVPDNIKILSIVRELQQMDLSNMRSTDKYFIRSLPSGVMEISLNKIGCGDPYVTFRISYEDYIATLQNMAVEYKERLIKELKIK